MEYSDIAMSGTVFGVTHQTKYSLVLICEPGVNVHVHVHRWRNDYLPFNAVTATPVRL